MLPHYAPLKVAEQFRVLDALAPGRVDLGIGRGPGADQQTSYALKPAMMDNPLMMAAPNSFACDVADVVAWSRSEPLPDDHPFAGIRAQPLGPTAPEPWLLGSSPITARLAADLGLPYCFAHFFYDGEGVLKRSRLIARTFSRAGTARPLASLCVWAFAAPNLAKAERVLLPYATCGSIATACAASLSPALARSPPALCRRESRSESNCCARERSMAMSMRLRPGFVGSPRCSRLMS